MARSAMKPSPKLVAQAKATLVAAAQDCEANRPKDALARLDMVLKSFPNSAQAHALRSTALMKLRQVDLALAALGRACECAPKNEALWTRYVTDLHKAGQKGRARRVADKAPLPGFTKKRLKKLAAEGPNLATTSLGEVPSERVHEVRRAIEAAELDQASALLEPLIGTWPEVAFLHNMRGIIAMEREAFEGAEASFRTALELSPGFTEAKANLGAALCRMDRISDALTVLEAAHAENPLDLAVKYNLADALYQSGQNDLAMDLGEELLKKAPDNISYLSHKARVLAKQGRDEQVVATIEQVWRIDGVTMGLLAQYLASLATIQGVQAAIDVLAKIEDDDEIALLRARYTAQAGDLDQARSILVKRLAKQDNFVQAFGQLGLYGKWQKNDPLLSRMRELFGRNDLPAEQHIQLGFALGKALEDIGAHAESFAILKRANDVQRARLGNWATQYDQFVDDRIAQWDRDTIEALRQKHAPAVKPIFIVGMPRTGSSLTEAILGRHPDVFDLGEDQFTVTTTSRIAVPNQDSVRELAQLVGDNFRARVPNHPVATDKHLSNSQHIGPLSAALPNAKFVVVRRNPRAICLSIYQNRFSTYGHRYAMNLEDLAYHYVQFDRLMKHWRSVLDEQLIEVQYEDLVSDPEAQTRKLIADLDLSWDDACLAPESSTSAVRTLSIGQVRQGVYDSSRDRWRNYEEELQPLIRILEQHGL